MFGCECWAHIPDNKQKKLDPKSHKCIFIGYSKDSKAYRLFDTSTQSVIIRRDVHFAEVSSPPESVKPHVTLNMPLSPVTPISISSSSSMPVVDPSSASSSSIPPECTEVEETFVSSNLPIWARKTIESASSEVGNPSDPRRTRSNFSLMTKVLATDDLTSYAQAQGKPQWEQAMTAEYDLL